MLVKKGVWGRDGGWGMAEARCIGIWRIFRWQGRAVGGCGSVDHKVGCVGLVGNGRHSFGWIMDLLWLKGLLRKDLERERREKERASKLYMSVRTSRGSQTKVEDL